MPSKPSKKKIPEVGTNYQALREQLDEVVLKLQDPECNVDEAVDLYEQSLVLIGKLEAHLEQAENRITKVQAKFGMNSTEG